MTGQLLYEFQLKRAVPNTLFLTPYDPCTPDAAFAHRLLEKYTSASENSNTADLWQPIGSMQADYIALQTFSWLRDFQTLGVQGAVHARKIFSDWMSYFSRYTPQIWVTSLVAPRIVHSLCHAQFVLQDAAPAWRTQYFTFLTRHARHLLKNTKKITTPEECLLIGHALCLTGLVLPHHKQCEEQGTAILQPALQHDLYADGGHISRNPSIQLRLVVALQRLVKAYEERQRDVPKFLLFAESRAVDMLAFFRCPDGRLAVFNGSQEDDPKMLASALSFKAKSRPEVEFASHTGFRKLIAARTSVTIDLGGHTQHSNNTHTQHKKKNNIRTNEYGNFVQPGPYQGAFSFQLNTQRCRLVTNCGAVSTLYEAAALSTKDDWTIAMRLPEAHSTISPLASLCEAPEKTHTIQNAPVVEQRMQEDHRGQWLFLERHNLWGIKGVTHRRSLFLDTDGNDLRGEDVLTAPTGNICPGFMVNFHLHPTVKALSARDGKSILLQTAQKQGWRFVARAPRLFLEKSVYCGDQGRKIPSEQIRLHLADTKGQSVRAKWSFKKIL